MSRLHDDALRLLHHVAYVTASGNVDDEGLIGREREDHRFGSRRATILRRYQAELGLLHYSPPSVRSSDTTRSTSPSSDLGPGTRDGGVLFNSLELPLSYFSTALAAIGRSSSHRRQ